MNFEIGKFNPCLCKHAERDITLFYRGNDLVVLVEGADLERFATELGRALIGKVRDGLGSDESDLMEICQLIRIVRSGWTGNGLPATSRGRSRPETRGHHHGC